MQFASLTVAICAALVLAGAIIRDNEQAPAEQPPAPVAAPAEDECNLGPACK